VVITLEEPSEFRKSMLVIRVISAERNTEPTATREIPFDFRTLPKNVMIKNPVSGIAGIRAIILSMF
jgi:hypothetical protein